MGSAPFLDSSGRPAGTAETRSPRWGCCGASPAHTSLSCCTGIAPARRAARGRGTLRAACRRARPQTWWWHRWWGSGAPACRVSGSVGAESGWRQRVRRSRYPARRTLRNTVTVPRVSTGRDRRRRQARQGGPGFNNAQAPMTGAAENDSGRAVIGNLHNAPVRLES